MTDRQTHQRCKHPTLGEGVAIYDNGPARFVADSGEEVDFARITLGGCSSVGPMKSWVTAVTTDGLHDVLDTSDRKRGERHQRIVTIDGRAGWLVDIPAKGRSFLARFDPDGSVSPGELFTYSLIHVCTPREYKARESAMKKAEKRGERYKDTTRSPWITAGDFIYCREPEYPGSEAAEVALHGPKTAKTVAQPEPTTLALFPEGG